MDLETLGQGLEHGKYPVLGMLLLDLLVPLRCPPTRLLQHARLTYSVDKGGYAMCGSTDLGYGAMQCA
eukprot:254978-Rhodomonas_salina.1